MKLKLGTRRSLLARAQSAWVAREVERLSPGVEVELVGIDTRGDRILDAPLSSVEGKEFFVAELDEALRSGRVDFNVHSMKDLSLERPDWIRLAATPTRADPRDILVFTGARLGANGAAIRIGTSSPRRLANVAAFLARALPGGAGGGAPEPRLEFAEIRGNVNTRLSRLHEPEGEGSRRLDGVVLALAGLIRLHADEGARPVLERLLRGTRFMVLPLRENPTAPGQGVLAVECRSEDERVLRVLAHLHHPQSGEQAARERAILADWGGGCHQRFGATAVDHSVLGKVMYVRGFRPDGAHVSEVRWDAPAPPRDAVLAWDGTKSREKAFASPHGMRRKGAATVGFPVVGFGERISGRTVFLSHSRAWPEEADPALLDPSRVWASGPASWFRLARRGVWVEGCAEEGGFEGLLSLLGEPVLGLFGRVVAPAAEQGIVALTHESAVEEWGRKYGISAVATYRAEDVSYREEDLGALGQATHVFWSSASQYHALKQYASARAHQACAAGKTYESLKGSEPRIAVFPSAEEWRKWMRLE